MRNVLFSQNRGGDFFEVAADIAEKQAERKRTTLAEIRRTLSEKDVYAPYNQSVSKFLTDQIEQISQSMDVDPAAYTDAASNYFKYYNMANQMKEFVTEAANVYKADKQVNEAVALKAMRNKYVVNGTVDELERNIANGIDAEQVLLSTPGALNEKQVLSDAVTGLGEVAKDMTMTADQMKKLGFHTLGLDTESIKAKYSNLMTLETLPNGQVQAKIKDINALENEGFMDVFFANKRIDSVVTQALVKDGVKEITEDLKKEKLREMLTPFVSSAITQTRTTQMRDDPTAQLNLQRAELELRRKKFEAEVSDAKSKGGGVANVIFDRVKQVHQTDPEKLMDKKYTGIDDPGYPKNKDGTPKLAPNKQEYAGYSTVFANIPLDKSRRLGNVLYTRGTEDEPGKAYIQVFSLNESGKVGDTKLELFNPTLFRTAMEGERELSVFNNLLNQSGLSEIKPGEIIPPLPSVNEPIQRTQSQQQGQQRWFDTFRPIR